MTDWPAVVREYGPLVWRTAYRLVGSDADAADCYQQAFLAAVRLAEAPSYGQPIIVYDPASRGAESYRELAREVLKRARRPAATV